MRFLAAQGGHLVSARSPVAVVGQFEVSEGDCRTEPSAVAPDAGVKLHTKQVAHHPRSFSRCYRRLDELFCGASHCPSFFT